jgi:5-(carboxyamino)imidazole ribonucleotide synthase
LTAPILPGATLGLLGGGQLGRMTALAAVSMGYRVVALDPHPDCPAKPVAERCWTAPFDDVDAAVEMARHADVVSLEIEKIALPVLTAAARHAPVRPSAAVMEIVQDRIAQKRWLARHGFPLGDWREVRSAANLEEAVRELGGRCFAKAGFGGYDGRGQAEIAGDDGLAEAWAALGGVALAVERALPLEREISVMVARRPSGETVAYPPAWNVQSERILEVSLLPAPIAPELAARARELAIAVADALAVEGLLCVEMFVVGGEILVNELAPRPHNSYHASVRGSATSQFEQMVRAICDLPLGATDSIAPAAIANLLGDLWQEGRAPDFAAALAVPGVRLHLYGKAEARPGRKMGHLSSIGATPDEALARVQAAADALKG